MKKYILLSILGLFSLVSNAQGTLSDSKKTPKQLLRQIKKSKAYLVDVRTPEEYNSGHLKYAKNVDFRSTEFKTNIGKLDKNKTVYLYCRSGNRSGKAVDTLKTLGFASLYNIGGLANLTVTGLPFE